MKLNFRIVTQIAPDWEGILVEPIGQVPATEPPPDVYVLVEKAGKPFRNLGIYFPYGSYNFNIKALHWQDWIAVGCCDITFFVSLFRADTFIIRMAEHDGESDYFSDFWLESTFLLIITGTGIIRVEADGKIAWRNHRLGLDGISVKSVSSKTIVGIGEWDPPSGSKPFKIKTATGIAMLH